MMEHRMRICVGLLMGLALLAGCGKKPDAETPAPPASAPAAAPRTEPVPPTPPEAQPAPAPPAPRPEPSVSVDDAPAAPSSDELPDLEQALEDVAALERNAEYYAALKRVRELQELFRDRAEATELRALRRRLADDRQTAAGLDFAVEQLGADDPMTVSVATDKLLDAGSVGRVFLRKAVRTARPKLALAAARILVRQEDDQAPALIVERVATDPPENTADDLLRTLLRRDTLGQETLARVCRLAGEKAPGFAGAVDVMVDRVDKALAEDAEPAVPPVLASNLYAVAATAEEPVRRRTVDALARVLDQACGRNATAFSTLTGSSKAYGFVGDYVATHLESTERAHTTWAIAHADVFGMQAAGLWGHVRLVTSDDPAAWPLLYERVDADLYFGNMEDLRKTGYVREGRAIQWEGFLDVPVDGEYKFFVDERDADATFSVDGRPVTDGAPVELTAGWHAVRATLHIERGGVWMNVEWERPYQDDDKRIPAERFACVDRTRLMIWRLARPCDLDEARRYAERLAPGVRRIDEKLASTLIRLAGVERPARAAVVAVLADVLDYSTAERKTPPAWEAEVLTAVWSALDTIEGPEQRRAAGALVNTYVRRTEKKADVFGKMVDHEDAAERLRDFVATRLDAETRDARTWAAAHGKPFGLVHDGIEAGLFDKDFKTRVCDRVYDRLDLDDENHFNYPDKRKDNMGIRFFGFFQADDRGEYTFLSGCDDFCRLWIDEQQVLKDTDKTGKITLEKGLHEIRVEYVETDGEERLRLDYRRPGQQNSDRLDAGELVYVDSVRLLLWKLMQKPDDPKAATWLNELRYKADRIDEKQTQLLVQFARKRPAWQEPMLRIAIAAASEDIRSAFVEGLAAFAPASADDLRKQAAKLLADYFRHVCGRDRDRFEKATGSTETFRFVEREVQAAGDSKDKAEREWAKKRAEDLSIGLIPLTKPRNDGATELTAKDARISGRDLRYSDQEKMLYRWNHQDAYAFWRMDAKKGGKFTVTLTSRSPKDRAGSEFAVFVDGRNVLKGKVPATDDWQSKVIGTIDLEPGKRRIALKPVKIKSGELMHLRSLKLEPKG